MLISSGGLYLTLMEIEIELRTNFVSRVARNINVTLVLIFSPYIFEIIHFSVRC